MDLKERTSTGILVKYVIVTVVLWGLAIGILLFAFWRQADGLLPALTIGIAICPIYIPDKNARIALNNQRITHPFFSNSYHNNLRTLEYKNS